MRVAQHLTFEAHMPAQLSFAASQSIFMCCVCFTEGLEPIQEEFVGYSTSSIETNESLPPVCLLMCREPQQAHQRSSWPGWSARVGAGERLLERWGRVRDISLG